MAGPADRMNQVDGAVIVDKPSGITSFVAVRSVRRLLGGARVGHLGTLDPLGTGVLPMLVGRATRLARFYGDHQREYVADVRFGWATTTYDREGEPLADRVEVALDRTQLEHLLASYRGTVSQVPPPVSAKKVGGVRAYRLARDRQFVSLDPVEVEIRELELLAVGRDAATVRCLCSPGTYIRSLAHDLGRDMGCGAHVASLRRTQVGEFGIDDALSLDLLESMQAEGRLDQALVAPSELLPDLPVHRVVDADAARIRHGRDFQVSPFLGFNDSKLIKALGPDGQLVCLGKLVVPRTYHPVVVFN